MEKDEVKHIIEEQKQLSRVLRLYFRTLQTEILQYIDDHLHELGKAELKIIIALFLEGQTDLSPEEIQTITGLHSNSITNNLFSKHVLAVKNLILDEMFSDEQGNIQKYHNECEN